MRFFCLTDSFCSGKRLRINLRHRSSANYAIKAGIPQNVLFNILCFEWAKESLIWLGEKLKVLSTDSKVLK